MKSRRPLRVASLSDGHGESQTTRHDPFAEVQLEKVLKELTFIRIQLDDVVLPAANPLIQKLHDTRQLYGFHLEYSFPCLDAVSKALKTTVRIPEKHTTATKIEFKHKRVVLLSMHEDQVAHWQRTRLNIHLLVQMAVNGKQTTRPLAKCSVPLYELLVAPYLICRDFDFVGADFEGSALIRIDLGSRVKPLMERLEVLRGERTALERTFVVPPGRRTRSRSSSRCRAHSSAATYEDGGDENREPVPQVLPRRPLSVSSSIPSTSTPISLPPPARLRVPSTTSSVGSDSVFARPKPTVLEHDRVVRTVSNSYGASTVGDIIEEVSRGGKYYMQLTVHEATGLPPVEDENGRITSPSSFVSVLGREGDLRSPVIPDSREPRWEFTARFAISSERRNLIVKVLNHGARGDTPLGFVTIALPVANTRRAVFEMADVTRMNRFTSQVPMLTISLERLRNVDGEEVQMPSSRRASSRMTSSSTQFSPPPALPRRVESPIIMESSEAIKGRMHRCMAELETMMRGINK